MEWLQGEGKEENGSLFRVRALTFNECALQVCQGVRWWLLEWLRPSLNHASPLLQVQARNAQRPFRSVAQDRGVLTWEVCPELSQLLPKKVQPRQLRRLVEWRRGESTSWADEGARKPVDWDCKTIQRKIWKVSHFWQHERQVQVARRRKLESPKQGTMDPGRAPQSFPDCVPSHPSNNSQTVSQSSVQRRQRRPGRPRRRKVPL